MEEDALWNCEAMCDKCNLIRIRTTALEIMDSNISRFSILVIPRSEAFGTQEGVDYFPP
jgi:hypothetical protein